MTLQTRCLGLVLACALALPLRAGAGAAADAEAGLPRLAVLQFELAEGARVDRLTFSHRLQNVARKRAPGLLLVTDANLEALLAAQGTSQAECEGTCAVETGRRLGADYVVNGRISRAGDRLVLSMQLHRTADGRLLSGEGVEAADEGALLGGMTEKADALFAPLARVAAGGGAVQFRAESEPAGAQLLLDGDPACPATPCELPVAAGEHAWAMRLPGWEEEAGQVLVQKGVVLRARLSRAHSLLTVETDPPGVALSIDGGPAEPGPLLARQLPPGTVKVAIEDPCFSGDGLSVLLAKGEERTLKLSARPREARLRVEVADAQGRTALAVASLDGRVLGPTPGPFQVPLCGRRLSVEAGERRAEQEVSLAQGREEVARLELGREQRWRRTAVPLEITSEPPGARVLMDDEMLCPATPCTPQVPEGKHLFWVRMEGYRPWVENVQAGRGVRVAAKLTNPAGRVAVRAPRDGVPVLVDGAAAGSTPLSLLLAPGPHTVALGDPCLLPEERRLEVAAGAETVVQLAAQRRTARVQVRVRDAGGEPAQAAAFADDTALGPAVGTLAVPVCARTLRVEAGRARAERPLRLAEGQPAALDFTLPVSRCARVGAANRLGAWATGLGLGLGGGAMAGALLLQRAVRDAPPGDAGADSKASAGRALNVAGLAGLGVGVAALVALLVLPGSDAACRGDAP